VLDDDPRVQFGEIDADTTLTGTWTHVNRGSVLRLTQASLQLRLQLMTDRAFVRRRRTFIGDPHGEPSWHRFKPRPERRYLRPSHFDEAGGRCKPGGSGKEAHYTGRGRYGGQRRGRRGRKRPDDGRPGPLAPWGLVLLGPSALALVLVPLESTVVGDALHDHGRRISDVYFPNGGVFSITNRMRDGALVEVAKVGREADLEAQARRSLPPH
jgi:hypothetical protein